jgi:hypothetical protein
MSQIPYRCISPECLERGNEETGKPRQGMLVHIDATKPPVCPLCGNDNYIREGNGTLIRAAVIHHVAPAVSRAESDLKGSFGRYWTYACSGARSKKGIKQHTDDPAGVSCPDCLATIKTEGSTSSPLEAQT